MTTRVYVAGAVLGFGGRGTTGCAAVILNGDHPTEITRHGAPASANVAVLRGMYLALQHLARAKSEPVEVCTNNLPVIQALEGGAYDAPTEPFGRGVVAVRELLGSFADVRLVHVPNRAGDPNLERAKALALQAAQAAPENDTVRRVS